jgi:hypothetical protein
MAAATASYFAASLPLVLAKMVAYVFNAAVVGVVPKIPTYSCTRVDC